MLVGGSFGAAPLVASGPSTLLISSSWGRVRDVSPDRSRSRYLIGQRYVHGILLSGFF